MFAHPRAKRVGLYRLSYIIDRAQRKAQLLCLLAIKAGGEDHRHIGQQPVVLDRAADVEAITTEPTAQAAATAVMRAEFIFM